MITKEMKKLQKITEEKRKELKIASLKYKEIYGGIIWNGCQPFPFKINELRAQIERAERVEYEMARLELKVQGLETWDELFQIQD